MIYILGHGVEVIRVSETENRICRRSGDDHLKLKHEARTSRQEGHFNVDDSFALCTRCGLAIGLKI